MATTLDRLSSKVHEMADHLEGFKVEIIRGVIMMTPVRPFHGETIFQLRDILKPQLPAGWRFITDVASKSPSCALTSRSFPRPKPPRT